jgi:hypothetical protein
MAYDPKLLKSGTDVAPIVGIGETDFGADYAAARARKPPTTDMFGHAAKGLKLALDDAGLKSSDIDGMVAALVPWMRVEEVLGLDLRFSWGAFWVHEAMALAINAIQAGAPNASRSFMATPTAPRAASSVGPTWSPAKRFCTTTGTGRGASPRRARSIPSSCSVTWKSTGSQTRKSGWCRSRSAPGPA